MIHKKNYFGSDVVLSSSDPPDDVEGCLSFSVSADVEAGFSFSELSDVAGVFSLSVLAGGS